MNDQPRDRQTSEASSTGAPRTSPLELDAWQQRLLPIMVRVLVGLTLFFFAASLGQLAFLQYHIQKQPESALAAWLNDTQRKENSGAAQSAETEIAARLESDVIARRYQMAATLLMGQLWIRYLGFVTGMILAIIGAVFILGKLREPTSEVQAESSGLSVAIKTASPGIILVVVGSGLMLATILTKQESWVTDAAVYMPGRTTSGQLEQNDVSRTLKNLQGFSKGSAADGSVKQE